MANLVTTPSVNPRAQYVKSLNNTYVLTPSDSVIHHKVILHKEKNTGVIYRGYMGKRYGVSSSWKLLPKSLLIKKFECVRDSLKYIIGLSPSQRIVTLTLLRYWSYYGDVYVKESTVTSEPGCSKATYWRTIRLLEDLGLITVVNRFLIRPHAQISNLYKLDRLVQMIARYLAEHIAHIWPDWFDSILHLTWLEFWTAVSSEGADFG